MTTLKPLALVNSILNFILSFFLKLLFVWKKTYAISLTIINISALKRNLNSDETLHPPDETAPAADQTLSRAEENSSSAEVTLHLGNQLQDPGDGSPDLANVSFSTDGKTFFVSSFSGFLCHFSPAPVSFFSRSWFHLSQGSGLIFLRVLLSSFSGFC